MAVPNAFRAFTVTFAAVSMTTIQSVTTKVGGTAVDFISDASPFVTGVFVDQIAADITIVITDMTQAKAAGLQPGTTGALVITYQLRAEGRGAAGSGNAVATLASSTIISADFDGQTNDVGKITLTFRCSSAGSSSTSPCVWS